MSTDGFSRTPEALGPNVRGGGVDIGTGSDIVIAPTKPVTIGPADGLTGQPMRVRDGAGVGAGSIPVPAPIKSTPAEHEGALTDQPMNAASLALFARVTKLESDIRAARGAEQDQAALHGSLWAELKAVEAAVGAVPVPLATPRGRLRPCGAGCGRISARGFVEPPWPHAGRASTSVSAIVGVWYARFGASQASSQRRKRQPGRLLWTTRAQRFPTPLPRKTVSVDGCFFGTIRGVRHSFLSLRSRRVSTKWNSRLGRLGRTTKTPRSCRAP